MKNIVVASSKIIIPLFFWVCLLIAFIYIVRDFPSKSNWQQLFSSDHLLSTLMLSACVILAMVARGIRWAILLRQTVCCTWWKAVAVFGWCFLLMTFSPFRSGELSRAWWVSTQGGSGTSTIGSIVVERLADLFVLLLLFGIVIFLYPSFPPSISLFGMTWLVIISAFYSVTSLFCESTEKFISSRFLINMNKKSLPKPVIKLCDKIPRFFSGIAPLGEVRTNLKVFLLTLFVWGILANGFYFYLESFFDGLNVLSAICVLVFVNLAGLIGISPGNIGVYEMAGIIALQIFDVVSSDTLVVMVGLHFIVISIVVLWGLFCRFTLSDYRKDFWKIV